MIGASGAIAGVMGAYFVLYPHSRILTAVFLVLFLDIVEIPAIFFLGVWFILQLVHGSISGADGGGIAFWAHAGGFAAGVAIGLGPARPGSGYTGLLAGRQVNGTLWTADINGVIR